MTHHLRSNSFLQIRCLYCHRTIDGQKELVAHEKVCDARKYKEQEWQRALAKAKRNERLHGYL